MASYKNMTVEELTALKYELEKQYEDVKGKGLSLNMARGKPASDQLDLTMDMLDTINSRSIVEAEDGTDLRNYGIVDGIPEAKKLMADFLEVKPEQVIVFGNASLNIMYDMISRSFTHGVLGGTPWSKLDKVKFLCPAPGYDRHFKVTEHFGCELITVPMTENGPDMDVVEKYVNEDPEVKGIWVVPKYSNPQGYSCSDETVLRFANLKPAAEDFRIYWDNAYAVHHLYEGEEVEILNIIEECEKAGNPNMVYEFASTSKITFPGAGISCMASSVENIASVKKQMSLQTIGHDKINQLRHVKYFKNFDGIKEHMKKHADILRPKFEAVVDTLQSELGGLEIGTWTCPKGGYFVSFDSMEGCAKAIVAKTKEAGVTMTGAGATFPYGKDPKDTNIRIAPSYPTPEDLKLAAEIFVLSVKLVSVDKLLGNL